jgi:hypothetical protein
LVPTSPVGLTDDWLGFLEGIDSLSESSLAAASISLTELGTRGVLGFGPWEHGQDVARAVGALGAEGRCACGGAEARHGGGERRGLLWISAVEWEAQGAVGC